MSKNIEQIYVENPATTVGNTDLIYLGQGGTADAAITGADFIAQLNTPVEQEVHVASNGSNTTGNGSISRPYASIGHALSTITDSASTKPYVVWIHPGTYSETGLTIPVWVFLVGDMQQPTKIIDSSGAITISSSAYNSGSQRLGFQNLNLINSTGLTIDFQAIGGSGSNDIYINNCQIVGAVTFRGRGSDFLTGNSNQIFGAYTSSGMQEVWFGGYFASSATFNTSGVTSVAASPEFTGVDLFGSVTFTSSGSGNTMVPTLISSQVSGTLTVDQATTTLSADDVSLNAGTLSITNSGVIVYLSVAKYEGYTPAVSGNWSPVPTEVAGALDTLGATGVIGPFTAGSVIFSNGTKLTQDNANLNWNDANGTLTIVQPSTVAGSFPVLVVTSDPSGTHGHGQNINIDGNPSGGGTIARTDGGLFSSFLQLTGGDHTTTTGGTIYLNGNNSTESGSPGSVQATLGISSAAYQFYDYTQSILLFQVNNAGVVQIPELTTFSVLATDGSHNVTPISSSTAGFVLTSNGAGSAPTFQATSSGSITIDGDSGSATGSTITLTAINGDNNSGSSVSFSASGSTVVLNVTDSNNNTIFGLDAGNNSLSGSNNAAFGWNSLLGLTGGAGNTSVGAQALQALQSGSDNTAIGYESLFTSTADSYNVGIGTYALYSLNGGSNNVSLGYNTGENLLTGNSNLFLGNSAGSSYGSSESNNICLNTYGSETPSENNVLRIGSGTGASQGQLNSAYIQGIYSNSQPSSGSVDYVTIDTSTGLLGVTSIGAGGINWSSPSSSESIVANNGYFTRGVSQVVMTLPATSSSGDTYIISNTSAAGFQIAQNAGQQITFGNQTTTSGTGGSITSTNLGDTVTIVCSVANTAFQVINSQGQLTVT